MRLLFRPLGVWPRPKTAHPDRSPFTSGWPDTVPLLEREIGYLIARGHPEVLIQVDAPEGAMRLDGGIRADARTNFHGVMISFESKFGPQSYLCDKYNIPNHARRGDPNWIANARAIALGLEALRKIDRYGISDNGQQYTGWKALGPGIPMPAARMTVEEAARFIASYSDDPNGRRYDVDADPTFATALFKEASKRLHPDSGGNPALFAKLVEAREIIEKYTEALV